MPGPDIRRYQFGPLEARGLIGGLRMGQAGLVAGALVVGVVLLYLLPTGPNAFAALGVVLTAAALAFWPVRGRTLEEWLPVVFALVGRRLRGRQKHQSSVPTAGARVDLGSDGASADAGVASPPTDVPEGVGEVELLSFP